MEGGCTNENRGDEPLCKKVDSMETQSKEFLSPRELAGKIGMSLRFIEDNTRLRKIPGAIKIGRVWRYRVTDVEKALLRGTFLIEKEPQKALYPRRLLLRQGAL